MKRVPILILALIVSVFVSVQTQAQSKKKAPNFVLKGADGKTYDLSKMKGKVVVVNFWATWCGPCRKEIPDFIEVYRNYKEKGAEIVGVSLDEGGWDDVLPFLKTNRVNYPIVIGNSELAFQFGDVQAIPTTFFIDKTGNIAGQHVGLMTKAQLVSRIQSLL